MSGAGDNYEAVDMEESADESGSDNEAFATKQEYKAYKEQFKVSKVKRHIPKISDFPSLYFIGSSWWGWRTCQY